MKALAGVMLAVALAVGIGSEASAQSCKRATKATVKHSSTRKKTCTCKMVRKAKKPSTGIITTSTYGGYMPGEENRETLDFPVNPLPGPTGHWDNSGLDNRNYPPQNHLVFPDAATTPGTNTNTNSNMNWLQNTDQQK